MGKPPLSAEDFYELDVLSDPQVSPDSQWVVFVRCTVDRQENGYQSAIWLAPAGAGAQDAARPFTAGTHRDTSPRWSPDGRLLAFLSDRAGDKSQVYLVPVDGGEARHLTRAPNGADALAWSPDGSRIAFLSSVDAEERAWEDSDEEPPPDPDERKLWADERARAREKREDPRLITRFPYRVGTRYLGDRYPHVYVVDVPADPSLCREAKPRRITDGDRVYGAPVWMPAGDAILSTVNRDPDGADYRFPTDVVRISAAGGAPHVIVGGEQSGTHDDPRPSPDGQWIAYLTRSEARYAAQNARLAVLPVGGGKAQLVTEALDANVASYRWRPDSQSLYLAYGSWGNVGVHRVSLTGEATHLVAGGRVVLGFDIGEQCLAP